MTSTKSHRWKTIMPSWTIHNKTIPARTSPPLGNAFFFYHQMVNSTVPQMGTHSNASLATTHNHRICFFCQRTFFLHAPCISSSVTRNISAIIHLFFNCQRYFNEVVVYFSGGVATNFGLLNSFPIQNFLSFRCFVIITDNSSRISFYPVPGLPQILIFKHSSQSEAQQTR